MGDGARRAHSLRSKEIAPIEHETIMPTRSKVHHYVPQVLQRQFLAQNSPERIWYSERDENNIFCAPYLKNISKTFQSKNFYTVLSEGELSDVIERVFYGSVDNYLGEVIPKIVDNFSNGFVTIFDEESRASLSQVVLAMAKRVPEFTKNFDENRTGLEIAEAVIKGLGNDDNEAEVREMTAAITNPAKLKELGRTVRVKAAARTSDEMIKMLGEFSVRWALIRSHHSYILSSTCVYRIGNGGSNGLSNPNAELWFPISPKVCLVLVRDPFRKIPLVSDDIADHIRKVNEHAMAVSDQIASHSQRLIESLTKKKARQFP